MQHIIDFFLIPIWWSRVSYFVLLDSVPSVADPTSVLAATTGYLFPSVADPTLCLDSHYRVFVPGSVAKIILHHSILLPLKIILTAVISETLRNYFAVKFGFFFYIFLRGGLLA